MDSKQTSIWQRLLEWIHVLVGLKSNIQKAKETTKIFKGHGWFGLWGVCVYVFGLGFLHLIYMPLLIRAQISIRAGF